MTNKSLSDNLTKTGYNREDLYRQASRDVIARQSGLQRYLLDILGPDLVGSLAFAIDPYRQFRNTPRRVSLLTDGSKIVRTRRPAAIQPSERREDWKRVTLTRGYNHNPQAGLTDYYYTGPVRTESSGFVNRGDQALILGTIQDTTRRTRPLNYTAGEFELFIPRLTGKSFSVTHKRRDELTWFDIGTGQRVSNDSWTISSLKGPEFRVTQANVDIYLTQVRARAIAAMQSNVYAMLDRVHPRHKDFDLFYQIAELRDLLTTLRGTLEIWVSFERLIGSNRFRSLFQSARNWLDLAVLREYQRVLGRNNGFAYDELLELDRNAANAFLTFKFGWESMIRGLSDFLPSPKRVGDRVNDIIARNGQDTSRRTKKTWVERETSVPPLSTLFLYKDESSNDLSIKTEGSRSCELRLVANFTINFPTVDSPRLRSALFARRIGAEPSPSDLYNLIPWTWLADWFGGAGDYVQLMDSVSGDQSLINNGFITYREVSRCTASMGGYFRTTISQNINGTTTTRTVDQPTLHQGVFTVTYQLRRSIPSLTNVKSYWDPSIGPSQAAIIGALLTAKGSSGARRDAS